MRIITRKLLCGLQQNCSPFLAGCAADLRRRPHSSPWLKERNCRVSVFLYGGLSAGVCGRAWCAVAVLTGHDSEALLDL